MRLVAAGMQRKEEYRRRTLFASLRRNVLDIDVLFAEAAVEDPDADALDDDTQRSVDEFNSHARALRRKLWQSIESYSAARQRHDEVRQQLDTASAMIGALDRPERTGGEDGVLAALQEFTGQHSAARCEVSALCRAMARAHAQFCALRDGVDVLRTVQSKPVCSMCFDEIVTRAVVPCGHCFCEKCAFRLHECALCRGGIVDRMSVYM